MQFSFVFVASCESRFGTGLSEFQIPASIDRLVAPRELIRMDLLDMEAHFSKNEHPSDSIFAFLKAKFPNDVAERRERSIWQMLLKQWMFFVPLGAVLVGVAIYLTAFSARRSRS